MTPLTSLTDAFTVREMSPAPSKLKSVDIPVTETHITNAKRDVTGRCMVAEAIKSSVVGVSHVQVDMQTIRFTRNGERETYFTPWDVGNAIVRFDGGDPIEPFNFRLLFRNRVIIQRSILETSSKPVEAARNRATRAKTRAATVAADPEASPVKRQRAQAKAKVAQADFEKLKAEHGPIRTRVNRPVARTETTTERGVRDRIPTVRYPNLQRTGQRKFGQRIMRANQPDARKDRGFDD
jgi:hypothetical protein